MQTGPSHRKQRVLARSFVVTVAVGVPAALAVGIGCGASTPDNNATSSPGLPPQQPGVQSGKCTDEGAQQPCHFSLGRTAAGTVQSCFSGTQTCTGGLWSGCGGDGTITNTSVHAGLNLAAAGVGSGGLHTQALGPVPAPNDGRCDPKVCTDSAGSNKGKACTANADCGSGNICAAKQCSTGTNKFLACLTVLDCPGGGTCDQIGETFATDAVSCAPPAADAGLTICSTDPCNPDCQGWATATTVSSSTGGADGGVIGVSGFGQIPGGQLNKLLLDKTNTATNCDNFTSPGLPSSYYNCQVDTYCQMAALGGDGNCHQFAAGAKIGTDPKSMGTANAGFDVTMGPGCSNLEADKYRYFPICNRGTLPIPIGTVIRVKYFVPIQNLAVCQNNSCTSTTGFDCSMLVGDPAPKNGSATTGALLPGTCQLLDTQQAGRAPGGTNCAQPNGEMWMYANCDGAAGTGVVETPVTMNPLVATPMAANEPILPPGTAGCANNWSDHAGTNNPPSCGLSGQNVVTFSNDYHAVCPVGTKPLWDKLNYDTISASNASGTAEVFFEAAMAPDVAGVPGVFSNFFELAEATDDSFAAKKDPEKCSTLKPFVAPYAWPTCTNDPAPAKFSPCCPKDIEDQLTRSVANTPFPGADPVPGAALARQDWMRLQITVKATPDNAKNATLNSWSLSYQCIAAE